MRVESNGRPTINHQQTLKPQPSTKHLNASPTIPRSKRPYGRPLQGRFRLGRRIAVLVAAVMVLGLGYQLSRPPELVWWTSPALGNAKVRAKLLIPSGWYASGRLQSCRLADGNWVGGMSILPVTRVPGILRRFFPPPNRNDHLTIWIGETKMGWEKLGSYRSPIEVDDRISLLQIAGREIHIRTLSNSVRVEYVRSDLPAFNRTYKQICNSLTIE